MRNKKMMLAGFVTLMMGVSLAGCGNDDNTAKNSVTTDQVTETETEAETEETENGAED